MKEQGRLVVRKYSFSHDHKRMTVKEVPVAEFMMFADDIVLCGGKEVDVTEYLDT